jgi:hypothetical protein
MRQTITLDDVVYFHFGVNDTAGSGADGSTPEFFVRLAGDTASAAPIEDGTPTLITHANYPDGAYEVAISATTANGFVEDGEYAVFCTLLVDSQNPTGYVGSFYIQPELGTTTNHFTNQTTNATSTVETVNGQYVVHVSGTLDGATLTLEGGSVGQNPATFNDLRVYGVIETLRLVYAGDIRFAITNAGAGTTISVTTQQILVPN